MNKRAALTTRDSSALVRMWYEHRTNMLGRHGRESTLALQATSRILYSTAIDRVPQQTGTLMLCETPMQGTLAGEAHARQQPAVPARPTKEH